MDNSPEYILMCEKAQEIQKMRFTDNTEGSQFLKEGDYHFDSNHTRLFKNKISYVLIKSVWLPRQDQLQEMCFYENRNTLFALQVQDFYCFFFRQLSLAIHNGSMEKAWLMYVMETKFSKRWNHNEQNWEEIK